MDRRHFIAGAAGLFGGALAGGARAQMVNMVDLLKTQGRYFPSLVGMRASSLDDLGVQMLANYEATVGDEAAAARDYAAQWPKTPPVALPAKAVTSEALSTIVARAKDHQIVMLNEAHCVSRDRVFAEQVVVALAGLGFTHFAGEALPHGSDSTYVDALNAGGEFTTAAGMYNLDPCYAEMLRTARAAGYRLHAYDAIPRQHGGTLSDDEQIALREAAAAESLKTILDADPKAKLLIYCGYNHINKDASGRVRWLAAFLKELCRTEPLCISQSHGAPAPDPAFSPPGLEAVLSRFSPVSPVSIADASGAPVMLNDDVVDLAVYHPRLAEVEGRPGWLAQAYQRKPMRFQLPKAITDDGLLQAVRTGGPINAIPADQFPLTPGAQAALFFVKPGRYDIYFDGFDARTLLGQASVA